MAIRGQEIKEFLLEPQNIGGQDKEFFVSLESTIPDAVNFLNKFLPINIPLVDIDDLPTGVSALGLPVLDSLRILGGIYSDRKNPDGISYQGLLINTVVFEASQQKNIVKTMVQGRERTIKEYISSNDINITITGVITNESFRSSYPKRDVELFHNLMKVPQALKVQSKFLQNLGIKEISVESWRLLQQAGFRNVQAFTINATSDFESSVNDLTGENR